MMDITLASFIALFMIVFATAGIQAVVGFGFALLSVPIMMQVVDLHRAVILASLIGTANNFYQYRDLKHDQDKTQVKRFLWASFIGAPLGLVAFIYADALQARKSEPQVFRATLNMIFLVSGVYGLVLFAAFGEIATSDLWLAAAVLPSMVIGVSIGRFIRNRVDPDRFRIAVLVLLTVAGFSSVFSGVFQ